MEVSRDFKLGILWRYVVVSKTWHSSPIYSLSNFFISVTFTRLFCQGFLFLLLPFLLCYFSILFLQMIHGWIGGLLELLVKVVHVQGGDGVEGE